MSEIVMRLALLEPPLGPMDATEPEAERIARNCHNRRFEMRRIDDVLHMRALQGPIHSRTLKFTMSCVGKMRTCPMSAGMARSESVRTASSSIALQQVGWAEGGTRCITFTLCRAASLDVRNGMV